MLIMCSEINTLQWMKMKLDLKVLFRQHRLFHLQMTTCTEGILLAIISLLINGSSFLIVIYSILHSK